MSIKTLLASTVAAFAVTGAAQAADLPSRKAAPVEYVRVCSTYGAGFFYIPGTDTCLRVGGRARYEYQYGQPFARGDSTTGSRTTGRIYLDARTATEYGLLRAFVRVDVQRRIAAISTSTGARIGTVFTGSGVDYSGAQTQVDLNRAFVQLGGLTAGRAQSYFDFYAGDLEIIGTTAGSSFTTNLLAYTATFGGGFSAALSIEDPVERRSVIADRSTLNPALGTSLYGGSGVPDLVAVLRADGSWGTAQLSGALHQVRPQGGAIGTAGYSAGTEYGYALNAGVKFNLNAIGAGDQLWLQGTYTKGAISYVFSNPFGWGRTGASGAGGYGVGATNRLSAVDAILAPNGGTGSLELTTAWGLTAAFLHNWTPTVSQAVFGSYVKVEPTSNGFLAANGGSAVFNGLNSLRNWNYWAVGTNVNWQPVRDLNIGAEVVYLRANAGNGGVASNVAGDPATLIKKSDSAIVTRLRIARDF